MLLLRQRKSLRKLVFSTQSKKETKTLHHSSTGFLHFLLSCYFRMASYFVHSAFTSSYTASVGIVHAIVNRVIETMNYCNLYHQYFSLLPLYFQKLHQGTMTYGGGDSTPIAFSFHCVALPTTSITSLFPLSMT